MWYVPAMISIIANWPSWAFYLCAGFIGAILGSFANVCIVRLPQEEAFWPSVKILFWPPSHCPKCSHRLSWWENVPLISYLVLRGRCRACHASIALRYPLVELACIVLALFSWWYFRQPLPFLLYFIFLIVPLVIITVIDLDCRIIPDVISIPGIFTGMAIFTILEGQGHYGRALLESFAGALVGGGLLYLVATVYERVRHQEGLGGGDVKLMAMLGAFFGWRAALLMLLTSSILGSIVGVGLILILRRDFKYAIPYGPFLALAGLIYLFVGRLFLTWYIGLFS